jgi:hypothetical protein
VRKVKDKSIKRLENATLDGGTLVLPEVNLMRGGGGGVSEGDLGIPTGDRGEFSGWAEEGDGVGEGDGEGFGDKRG